ncbi:inter-alpha-trypsin inhibitor heavy chain h5 [Phtheirospermum japonicum]|uniref:Inter-alpha-trypsin inhibitor heavy chain h5 n=1 Tax=Phtheirospermum japonicum TaxID=374723 RepID=A0A830BB29_9LAMI|nr:inter-alpha-trypsin inhibitor heavy chain h5 [Phtheirospermum japonicum]
MTRAPRRTPSPRPDPTRNVASLFHAPEPAVFDDDDEVVTTNSPDKNDFNGPVEVKTYPEVSAVSKSKSLNGFSILVHLKAPITSELQHSRAPVDLVTVLDVSGSMAGTKLALLKRAMGFVIQNLGPSDRLSVIAFSSTARRLFPLRRMTENGRQEALQAVYALTSNGGTNISEGLRKAAKVLTDCKWKNPIGSIILLSDGQDTYARSEAEGVIQDAFAQCIGGLLSVVVQELKVEIECVDPILQLVSIKSGSYKTVVASDKRRATIEVGDLYADEERDFLVTTDIPICEFGNETSLIKVGCRYKHPISKNLVSLDSTSDVKIRRPILTGQLEVSMEVDRQRNRLGSAEAMSEAKAAAERGDLTLAVSVLGKCREALSESVSARAGDRLCVVLDAELREMQERMANQHVYERSGRAYVLSGLSSHSWQRATARGDSTDVSSLVQAYQTPSMVDMVNLSQTMVLGSPTRPTIRPTRTQPR